MSEVAAALAEYNVETQWMHIGKQSVRGCIDCHRCRDGKCVFGDDIVNELIENMRGCDALIVGSPVYYASPNGSLLSALDRAFFAGGESFRHKPAASVVSARRAGTTASLDVLNKYFYLHEMPIVTSQYWCMVHGFTPEDVKKDLEGLQIMRTLGRNMGWLLQCIQKSREADMLPPELETPRQTTNFIG